jgi:GNAT superfamily N-acetyltransferase
MTTTNHIHLRDFKPEDASRVNSVVLAAWQEFESSIPAWAELSARLGALVAHAHESEVIVAELDDQLLGAVAYVAARQPKAAFFPENWPIVRLLSVHPDARGHGLGRALLQACIARAQRDGASIMALHTTPVMASALRLYAQEGFTHHQDLPAMFGVPYVMLTKALKAPCTKSGTSISEDYPAPGCP